MHWLRVLRCIYWRALNSWSTEIKGLNYGEWKTKGQSGCNNNKKTVTTPFITLCQTLHWIQFMNSLIFMITLWNKYLTQCCHLHVNYGRLDRNLKVFLSSGVRLSFPWTVQKWTWSSGIRKYPYQLTQESEQSHLPNEKTLLPWHKTKANTSLFDHVESHLCILFFHIYTQFHWSESWKQIILEFLVYF